MATFVLIHGGGDVGWYWHLVEQELRQRGHDTLAPDLPCDDDSAGLAEYADTVVKAIGGRSGLIVAAQSLGGFTAPLVAARVPVDTLVLVTAMIPAPEEAPGDWPANAIGPSPLAARGWRNQYRSRNALTSGPAN